MLRSVGRGCRSPCRVARCLRVAPIQVVKVPVPVECSVEVPVRPAMPTEALSSGVNLDRFSASALAEIELREGYEGELRAALAECIKPVRAKRFPSEMGGRS